MKTTLGELIEYLEAEAKASDIAVMDCRSNRMAFVRRKEQRKADMLRRFIVAVREADEPA